MSSHLDKAIAEARKTDGIYLIEIIDETSAFLHSSDFERLKIFETHRTPEIRVMFKSIEADVRAVHSKAFKLTNAKENFESLTNSLKKRSGGSHRKTHYKKSKKSTKRRRQNGRKSRKA